MDLPKKLWLITTNKIEFDYYEDFLGHIVSNKFLNLIKESNYLQHYVLSSLNIVSTKGNLKLINRIIFLNFMTEKISLIMKNQILKLEKYQKTNPLTLMVYLLKNTIRLF